MSTKILLPYNFTSHNQKAVDFVIQTFAREPEAFVTMFHAYAQLPEIDLAANPEMSKLRSPMISIAQDLREKEATLNALMEQLVKKGFSRHKVDCIFQKREKSVSDAIIKIIKKEGYQVVVLVRSPGKVFRMLGRGVSSKIVTSLTDVAVCIAL